MQSATAFWDGKAGRICLYPVTDKGNAGEGVNMTAFLQCWWMNPGQLPHTERYRKDRTVAARGRSSQRTDLKDDEHIRS